MRQFRNETGLSSSQQRLQGEADNETSAIVALGDGEERHQTASGGLVRQQQRDTHDLNRGSSSSNDPPSLSSPDVAGNVKEADIDGENDTEDNNVAAAAHQQQVENEASVVAPPPLSRMVDLSRQSTTGTPGAFAMPPENDGFTDEESLLQSEVDYRPVDYRPDLSTNLGHTQAPETLISAEVVHQPQNQRGVARGPETRAVNNHGVLIAQSQSMENSQPPFADNDGSWMSLLGNRRVQCLLLIMFVLIAAMAVTITVLATNEQGSTQVIVITEGGEDDEDEDDDDHDDCFEECDSRLSECEEVVDRGCSDIEDECLEDCEGDDACHDVCEDGWEDCFDMNTDACHDALEGCEALCA